jgi:signal transduction histidine kinase
VTWTGSPSAIEWLLLPWTAHGSAAQRAGRVGSVAGALTLLLLPSMILYFGIDEWWWDSTLAICLLTPAAIILFDNLAELVGRARGRPLRGPVRLGFVLLGFIAGDIAGYIAVWLWPVTQERPPALLIADFRRNLGIFIPVLAIVSGVGASLWYRAESYRLENAASVASFAVLKGQMQPHFLFNALNALKELIADDPEAARAVTQQLAELYRLILKVATEATTPLSDELAIVKHYLDVERVRYGERLRYAIDVDPVLLDEHVPSLLLQTLVENAIKHGISKARLGGQVRVRARRRDGGGLELEVSNTGAAFEPERELARDALPPTGLRNTRARLQLMYGSAGELSITTDPELGTRVRVFVSGEKLGTGPWTSITNSAS